MPTQPGPPLAEQGKYYWLNPPSPPPPHCFSVILLLYYFSVFDQPPLPVCEALCQPFPPLGTLPCPLCKCFSAGPKLTTLPVSSSLTRFLSLVLLAPFHCHSSSPYSSTHHHYWSSLSSRSLSCFSYWLFFLSFILPFHFLHCYAIIKKKLLDIRLSGLRMSSLW